MDFGGTPIYENFHVYMYMLSCDWHCPQVNERNAMRLDYVLGLRFSKPCCRMAYWSFRFDHKARQEANQFSRWSNCKFLCERCMAQRPTPQSDPNMVYHDFRPDAPHLMTQISHSTYLQTEPVVSPWVDMPGWSLKTCMHDLLHTVYLGFGRDPVGSLMSDFIGHNVLGPGSKEEQLGRFSAEMNAEFRKQKILVVQSHRIILVALWFWSPWRYWLPKQNTVHDGEVLLW